MHAECKKRLEGILDRNKKAGVNTTHQGIFPFCLLSLCFRKHVCLLTKWINLSYWIVCTPFQLFSVWIFHLEISTNLNVIYFIILQNYIWIQPLGHVSLCLTLQVPPKRTCSWNLHHEIVFIIILSQFGWASKSNLSVEAPASE